MLSFQWLCSCHKYNLMWEFYAYQRSLNQSMNERDIQDFFLCHTSSVFMCLTPSLVHSLCSLTPPSPSVWLTRLLIRSVWPSLREQVVRPSLPPTAEYDSVRPRPSALRCICAVVWLVKPDMSVSPPRFPARINLDGLHDSICA